MEDSVNETTVLQTILLANTDYSRFFAFLDDVTVEGFLRGVEVERDVDFFAAGLDFLAAADEVDFLAIFFSSTGSSAQPPQTTTPPYFGLQSTPWPVER